MKRILERHGIYYGWTMVILALVVMAVCFGISHNCFTLYIIPVTEKFGWQRKTFSIGLYHADGGLGAHRKDLQEAEGARHHENRGADPAGSDIAAVAIPIVWFLLKEKPADCGLLPYGEKPGADGRFFHEQIYGSSWAEALRSKNLYLLLYSALAGLLMAVGNLGGCIAPFFGNAVFDTTGSYRMAYLAAGIVTALTVLSSLVVKTMKKPEA